MRFKSNGEMSHLTRSGGALIQGNGTVMEVPVERSCRASRVRGRRSAKSSVTTGKVTSGRTAWIEPAGEPALTDARQCADIYRADLPCATTRNSAYCRTFSRASRWTNADSAAGSASVPQASPWLSRSRGRCDHAGALPTSAQARCRQRIRRSCVLDSGDSVTTLRRSRYQAGRRSA